MIVSIISGSRRRFDGNIRARELRPIRPNVKKGEWTGALSAPRDVLPIVEDCDVENQRGMMTLTARSSSRKDVTKGTRNSSNKKAGPTQLALIGDRNDHRCRHQAAARIRKNRDGEVAVEIHFRSAPR